MKIKPCPFCGDEKANAASFGNVFYVRCEGCHACGPDGKNEEEAITLWNAASRPEPKKSCLNCQYCHVSADQTSTCKFPVDAQGICIAWKPYIFGITEKACENCVKYECYAGEGYCIKIVCHTDMPCIHWCQKKEEKQK